MPAPADGGLACRRPRAAAEPRRERVAVRRHHPVRRRRGRLRQHPLAAAARSRRGDARADRAAAGERPRRLAADDRDQPARHLQRAARRAERAARARRRPRDPSDQRRRRERQALLERLQRLQGGRRAPRPLGRDRRRRHRLRRLLAGPGDHRDADAGAAALVASSPTESGSYASIEQRAGRTPEEVADAICELSRREPRTLNGQTFRVGAL